MQISRSLAGLPKDTGMRLNDIHRLEALICAALIEADRGGLKLVSIRLWEALQLVRENNFGDGGVLPPKT
jgi:hypothetical protein